MKGYVWLVKDVNLVILVVAETREEARELAVAKLSRFGQRAEAESLLPPYPALETVSGVAELFHVPFAEAHPDWMYQR